MDTIIAFCIGVICGANLITIGLAILFSREEKMNDSKRYNDKRNLRGDSDRVTKTTDDKSDTAFTEI